MDLHNPQNLKLPALKIEKKEDRKLIEDDLSVKNLIESKLLLNKNLNELLGRFLGTTKDINSLLERGKEEYHRYHGLKFGSHVRYLPFYRHRDIRLRAIRKMKVGTTAQKKEFQEMLEREFQEERKKRYQKLKNEINKLSNKLQSELDSFERKYKIKLDILESSSLYICKNCKKIFRLDRFHSKTCECGKDISNPLSYETRIVHKFGEKLIKFIEGNMWLEHGIDYLLRKKNFGTLCGFNILGHSGLWHEIDNVAEMNLEKLRIFCECKTGDVNINDVFIFSGKMADIGCTRGYIFTTSFDTNEGVKHLARSKNITVIEQVLEKDDKKIIKEIKEGS